MKCNLRDTVNTTDTAVVIQLDFTHKQSKFYTI